MKEILFSGYQMVLHEAGLLIWPGQKTAVVSDLHLEKASHYAQRGQMLPPHETFETLKTLKEILEFCACERLVLLGDSFHDEGGFQRMDQSSHQLFEQICMEHETIWVMGNHDGAFVPECALGVEEYKLADITFRHEAQPDSTDEISGHFHPKASLRLKGQRVSNPCFIEDGRRMILPAFGVFTGGLDVRDPAISDLFDEQFHAHVITGRKVFTIPSSRLNA